MSNDLNYRGRSIMTMTKTELRRALAETVRQMEQDARSGITVDQLGTGAIDRAFERATRP